MNKSFPSHLIDPKSKGYDWHMQFNEAMWEECGSEGDGKVFYNSRWEYEQNKMYAHGNQSINKYKPWVGVDEMAKEDWMSIDWSVIPVIPKFRKIALGKLNKIGYNMTATPVDILANDQTSQFFADQKAKIMVRNLLMQTNPALAQSPELQPAPGEAEDLEELEIQQTSTHKHQLAIEAEEGIKLVLEQNEVEKIREEVKEWLWDAGCAGVKEYIDSNGAIRVRTVNPRAVRTARTSRKDFKDCPFIGEVIEMTIAELKEQAGNQFSDAQYLEIAKKYTGKLGNPREVPTSMSVYNKSYDQFRIQIFDAEWFSVDEMVFEKRKDRRGNKVVGRADYDSKNKKKDKFDRVAYQVVYKSKWIVDSEYMYDWGLATDMKRKKSSLGRTSLSYHLYAPDFWDMRAYSIMEQMIPIADAIQIAWYKLQNAINTARPKGIIVEMGALEDIPLGKGGKKLTPLGVLDLYNKKGTLVYRKADMQGRGTNYRPIEEIENGLGKDVMNFWQVIQNNIQLLRDITGMNEFTDGSTPDPRTLTTVANLAAAGTSNALAGIVLGEKKIMESLCDSLVLRLQDVLGKGQKVQGYVRALGNNSAKFVSLSPALSLHEFGIFLEDKPTDEQKARLLNELANYKATGLIEPEDSLMIENCDNVKVCQQLLAYKVRKRKEKKLQEQIMLQQQNADANAKAGIQVEQARQQTLQVELQVKQSIVDAEAKKELALLDKKYGYELQLEQMRQEGKAINKDQEATGKKEVEKIRQGDANTAAIDESINDYMPL